MANPIVSIIVPCYNQAQYLDECLESVLNQNYDNWECVIVNDGSSDHTDDIAKMWQVKDVRFKYVSQTNKGLSNARNVGLDIATGAYFQFLDADDCLHVEKLSKSLTQIKDHSGLNIVISDFKMFKDSVNDELNAFCKLNQEILLYKEVLYGWDFKFNIPIHCGFFSSSLFNEFRFPENLKAKEDWIMWLTFFQKKIDAVFIDEILSYYRAHDKSMTKNFIHMLKHTIKALEYLEFVISENDYKSYLLYYTSEQIKDREKLRQKIVDLNERVVTSNNSVGFKIEKKIRNFFRR